MIEVSDRTVRRGSPGRGRGKAECGREGCPRSPSNGYTHCSHLCWLVDEQLAASQRICESVGQGSSVLWASAVALSDALSSYRAEHSRVFYAARDAGISRDQWAAIQGRKVKGGKAKPCL